MKGINGMNAANNELTRLLGRVDDWTEELLLRGTNQFASDDAARLESLADESRRLGMELLEELLRGAARAGEQSRLSSSGDEAAEARKLTGVFFRLCGYSELARRSLGGSDEAAGRESEAEAPEEDSGV